MSLTKLATFTVIPAVRPTAGRPYSRACPTTIGPGPTPPDTSGGSGDCGCTVETIPVQDDSYAIIGYTVACVPNSC